MMMSNNDNENFEYNNDPHCGDKHEENKTMKIKL